MNDKLIIDMKGIVKSFQLSKEEKLTVLKGIDLQIYEGQFVAIVGASGSGKSTLMNIIGALDKPTEGSYILDTEDISALNDKQLSAIRNQKIGFVFQTFNLIARTDAIKNVALPMLYAGKSNLEANRKALELLEAVDMADRIHHQPSELSGGQKQRVAIARSMINDPSIILADEPTGALDSVTGRLIMDLFHKLHREKGKTIVLITHSHELASECERVITLKDGMIINEERGANYICY
ncbi:MAG: ABC transporter ATP-binding protein [Oscillospiraceae bacterium]